MSTQKLTHKEFVVKAIPSLRKENFKGIHTVYSGFNAAARKYFNLDTAGVITMITTLVEEGVIDSRPTKDGFTIYLAGEKPENGNTPDDVLAKMGL